MSRFHILHTNDIHSHFEIMPHVASCIRHHKEKWESEGESVVVVDIGDHADRSHMQTEASWGQVNVEVMNATGYQLGTLGNNEGLTFPQERLRHLYDHAQTQILCSNFKEVQSGKLPPFLKPYTIQKAGPFRIGWIGVTASFPEFYRLLGWEVEDPIEVLSQLVPRIKSSVDFLVVLSHVGLPGDRRIAEQVQGIDLILGGHTHHVLDHGEKVNDTWISHAGKFGEYVGHVEVALREVSHGQREKEWDINIELYSSKSFQADQELSELIRSHFHKAEQEMNEVVTVIDRDIPHSLDQESPLGNMMAAGLRQWTNSEIGLVNSGQLLFSLRKGEIRRKTILSICPHPINPCRLVMTGKQIKQVLEEALLQENIFRQFRGFGFRGRMIGWMCADGLDIYYRPDLPPYQRIERIETATGPLEEEKTYRVGTIDMFTFGVLFPAFSEALEKDYFLPEFIRDVFAGQLLKTGMFEDALHPRWHRMKNDV